MIPLTPPFSVPAPLSVMRIDAVTAGIVSDGVDGIAGVGVRGVDVVEGVGRVVEAAVGG